MAIWIVEWSTSQRCCHVDLLSDAVSKNRSAIENLEHPDYVPVGAFNTVEQAEYFAEQFANGAKGELQ